MGKWINLRSCVSGLLTAMALLMAFAAPARDLPTTGFRDLSSGLGNGVQFREVISTSSGMIALVSDGPNAQSRPRVIRFSRDGQALKTLDLPVLHYSGLAAGAGETFYSQIVETHEKAIVTFDAHGRILDRLPLDKAVRAFVSNGGNLFAVSQGMEVLKASGGSFASVGTSSRLGLDPRSPLLLRRLMDGRMVLIDQSGATVTLIGDGGRSLSTRAIDSPHVTAARKKYEEYFRKIEALQTGRPGIQAKPRIVLSAGATPSGTILALISPVESSGATVLELTPEGDVVAEFTCPVRMAESSGGRLYPTSLVFSGTKLWLISTNGQAAAFDWPGGTPPLSAVHPKGSGK